MRILPPSPPRLAAALALAAIAGCGGPAPEPPAAPARGGTAILGTISDVDGWNEYLSRQSFASNVHRRIWLRLAQELGDGRDHPPSWDPLLAESWAFSEDGTVLTFRLREALWSDGRPVAASDVVFTWRAQTSSDVAWIGAGSKARVVSVEAADPRTVVFRFDGAYPDAFPDAVEGGILPEHVFGAVPFPDWRSHDWSLARVGSGPFLLERHAPGEEIALARNPRYFREGMPRLDRVVFRVVPDASSLVTQLLAGGLDYVEGVPPREADRVRSASGTRLLAFDYPMYDYVGWNGAKAPLDDPAVRRALTLAIDRKAIVDDLLYGFGRVSRGPVLSFGWGADDDLDPWPFDPAEARRLLKEQGFAPRPGDGTLVRDGKPFEIEMATNAGNRLRESVVVKIQSQLWRIGVRVRPVPLEMQTFVHRNTTGDFDSYVGGWRFSGKIELRPLFGSAETPPRGSNVDRYRSPEVDRLLDAMDRARDWRAAKPALDAIQREIHRDQPYTFLYETQRLAAAGPRLRDVEIDVPADPLARLERWWVAP